MIEHMPTARVAGDVEVEAALLRLARAGFFDRRPQVGNGCGRPRPITSTVRE